MEQIRERGGRRGAADQAFGLERLNRRITKTLGLGIEEVSERTAKTIGTQGLFQRARLQQNRESGQRPFANGGGGQRGQRRPQMLLGFGCHGDSLACQDGRDPFRRPAALGCIVDRGEGLQRN